MKSFLKLCAKHGWYTLIVILFIIWKSNHMDVGRDKPLWDAIWDNGNQFVHDTFMKSKDMRKEIKEAKEDVGSPKK